MRWTAKFKDHCIVFACIELWEARLDVDAVRSRVETDLAALCALYEVPGASVAIVVGDQIVEAVHGVTNTRTQVPVTPDTVFQIQSVTKVLTATLVMQLVDEDLIGLDDLVQAHLPFRTTDEAASRQVTVRHLLTHTGGFEGDLWQPTTVGDDALERFVQDVVAGAEQYTVPGTRFSYCSAGFGVLGRLVEVARGTSFEAALRRHLAVPLDMDELAFNADEALALRAAIGHVHPTESAPLRPSRHWALMPPSNPAAGNQLASSARGLAQVGRMFATAGRSRRGERVLSETAISQMLTPQLRQRDGAPRPIDQGLGWWLTRPGLAEHGGGAPGVASLLAVVPGRHASIAVLTNSDSGGRLATALLDGLFTELADLSPRTRTEVPDARTRVLDPAAYCGVFRNRQYDIEVSADGDGRLFTTTRPRNEELVMADLAGYEPSTSHHELRPVDATTFIRVTGPERPAGNLTFFDPDSSGRFDTVADERAAARVA